MPSGQRGTAEGSSYGAENPVSPRSWILPSNPGLFDATASLLGTDTINWSETYKSKSLMTGTVVYLYSRHPVMSITHKCVVVATGIPDSERDSNAEQWIDPKGKSTSIVRSWMRLRKVATFDAEKRSALGLPALQTHGLKGFVGSRLRVTEELDNYMQAVEVGLEE